MNLRPHALFHPVLPLLAAASLLGGCKSDKPMAVPVAYDHFSFTETGVTDASRARLQNQKVMPRGYVEIEYEPSSQRFRFAEAEDIVFTQNDFVKTLQEANVPKDMELRINIRDKQNSAIIKPLTVLLGKAGYARRVFLTDIKGSAEVVDDSRRRGRGAGAAASGAKPAEKNTAPAPRERKR